MLRVPSQDLFAHMLDAWARLPRGRWTGCIVAKPPHPAQPWASARGEPRAAAPRGRCLGWREIRLEWMVAESGPRFRSGCFLQLIVHPRFLPPRSRTGEGLGSTGCGMKGSAPRCRFTPFSAHPSLHPATAAIYEEQ